MAGKAGTSTDSVAFLTRLREEPWRFDFFQTLRRIEAMHADMPGLGRSSRPADDPIRLGQEPDLKFATASIAGFYAGRGGGPDRLATLFFGLFGPQGALPLHLTEYALQRERNEDDPTLARFADVFHHRMLSFLYRAWADAQPTVQLDRPGADRFSHYVGSLLGIGSSHLRHRDALDDNAKLHYSGAFALQTRNAEGLCNILQDFLRIPAAIEEFRGGWMHLPGRDLLRLGSSLRTGLLGRNTVAGAKVWGCQQKFRIVLGPMGIDDLRRMLPGGESIRRLVAILRNYVGDEMDWDVQLIVIGRDVPSFELGRNGRLGWTSWLNTEKRREADVGDVVIDALSIDEAR